MYGSPIGIQIKNYDKMNDCTNRYDTQSSKSLKPKLNRAMINCNFVSFLQIYNFEGKQNGIRTPTLSSSIFYNRRNFRQASSRKPFFLRDWKNDQSRGMPFALFNFADINCRRTLAANPRVFPCRMRTMAAGWIVGLSGKRKPVWFIVRKALRAFLGSVL